MAREDFSFLHPLRVRWAEVDMQGVVFNAHYLAYFDVALTEYWEALTGARKADGDGVFEHLYVVKSVIDYHASARFDDVVDTGVRIARLGRASMTCHFEIHRTGEHLITGETVYVHAVDGSSVPFPDAFRAKVAEFERTQPTL
ncbi:Probable 4-hydroxybenzoyl-CoA thioesterase [Mycobacteroides abscessus subsp. bolletii]|uniref:acyl-CoA thioesterase n=1 Tax=Mycobacteroides abscessus TaxID=36809 RepID=UPI00092651DF|nr:thioesterase family protein [Mycobacteroides abscessus]SHP76905.1 Probable 4-hydroxybenzoyl-CoA thioesterase [Mycobacteroides abscessus subsp. bolletii]SHR58076.1 Probable 4-hydroxybenzoyl-CoA thioesterase [Mycobacteroides abscessus subsp. bolletii]SHR99132.1 Probable 4-hydroxybenzoyl-CoA thioesterase [Mycobacteroides abscessus subsp. bolletii]SHS37845.1 Probable 4-hydroxybenzoyl-CoA thioesterase [Mycobacteroides abscessus subsp. bolletii]SHX89136.1 Probable 4-hydroxybenzoyl-CoA thioesteras